MARGRVQRQGVPRARATWFNVKESGGQQPPSLFLHNDYLSRTPRLPIDDDPPLCGTHARCIAGCERRACREKTYVFPIRRFFLHPRWWLAAIERWLRAIQSRMHDTSAWNAKGACLLPSFRSFVASFASATVVSEPLTTILIARCSVLFDCFMLRYRSEES